MKTNKIKSALCAIIILSLTFAPTVFFKVRPVSADTASDLAQQKSELEKQLLDLESQIAIYNQRLSDTEAKKQTLNAKIGELRDEQSKIKLQIQSTTLLLNDLNNQIETVSGQIQSDNNEISRMQSAISDVLASIYEKDSKPVVESLLSNGGFTSYLNDQDNLVQLTSKLDQLVQQTNAFKQDLLGQQVQLQQKQNDQNNLLAIQDLQNNSLGNSISQQNTILEQTKGVESNYESMISNSQKRANQIRGQIYELSDTNQHITFGQAVDMAQTVSRITGIEPSFLLAILTQESNLGKNVGTCNRAGDPPSKSWKVVMNPNRDQQPFVQITQQLGMDTDTTPISCPMHNRYGEQIGWGGAMGPAQFIPSTWMAHSADISAATGDNPPNPWDLKDSFVAAALLLKANGAVAGDENSEWAAAMRYFSGSTNPRYSFYGDSVMNIKHKYDSEIATLNSNN